MGNPICQPLSKWRSVFQLFPTCLCHKSSICCVRSAFFGGFTCVLSISPSWIYSSLGVFPFLLRYLTCRHSSVHSVSLLFCLPVFTRSGTLSGPFWNGCCFSFDRSLPLFLACFMTCDLPLIYKPMNWTRFARGGSIWVQPPFPFPVTEPWQKSHQCDSSGQTNTSAKFRNVFGLLLWQIGCMTVREHLHIADLRLWLCAAMRKCRFSGLRCRCGSESSDIKPAPCSRCFSG